MWIKKKNGIGILGGSFDPPHIAHLKISQISLKKIGLKKIFWIVTKKNPFKNKPYISLRKRVVKCKKLVKNYKNIEVLYLDDKLKSSRMINTINFFVKIKKFKNLYLILGSDNLLKLHKWTSWKKIVKLSKLIVFSRRGYDKKSKESIVVKHLGKKNIIFVKNKPINISSTSIRKKYPNRLK